jgi:ABC-type spermidine/putrescine transport system permease subunit II
MPRDADIVAPHGRLVRGLLTLYGVAMYLFLFVPIVVLVLLSFNTSRTVGFPLKHFTLAWYRLLPDDVLIQDALSSSIRIGLWVTVISTVIGTAAAFPLVRARMRYRSVVRVLITLPIMIPGLLIGVSLLILFTDVLKVQPGSSTAIVGQSVLVTPFVILIVAARLQGFDQNLERAASDLGANLVQRMRYVVLPLIAPGILAAALIALTLSIDEFIVTNFLIGSGQTLPIYVYNQIKFGITPEVNALASLMLLGTMLVFALGFAIPPLIRRVRLRRAVAVGRSHDRSNSVA